MKVKLFLSFLLVASLVSLTNGVEVLVATNSTYPDTIVAKAISEIFGYPLITIGKNGYSNLLTDLQELNATKVYIIGGPAVISTEVENEIATIAEVERIAGYSRFGTSYEVAKYFFGNASKVVIAIDYPDGIEEKNETIASKQVEVLEKAREIAVSEKIPLLLSNIAEVSKSLEDTLEYLGVEKIYLVGTAEEDVIEELNKSYEVEHLYGTLLNDKIHELILKRNCTKLLVIAIKTWKDIFIYHPGNSCVRIVTLANYNKSIEKLKNEIEENNVSKVIVRGYLNLVNKVCSDLKNLTEVDCQNKTLLQEIKEHKEEIKEFFEKRAKLRKAIRKIIGFKLQKICENAIEELNNTLGKLKISEGINEEIEEKVNELINKYYEAKEENKTLEMLKICYKIKKYLLQYQYQYKEALGNEITEKVEEEVKSKEEVKKTVVNKLVNLKLLLSNKKILKECLKELNLTKEELGNKSIKELKKILIEVEKCYIEKVKSNETVKEFIKQQIKKGFKTGPVDVKNKILNE